MLSLTGACQSRCIVRLQSKALRLGAYFGSKVVLANSKDSMNSSTSVSKHPQSTTDKAVPCNIERHLSKEAKARTLSSLSKFIFSFSGIPGMVSLHGGLPPPSIFPFKALKVQLEDGTWLDMSDTHKVCYSSLT